MDITLTTPALLFPANCLLLLAFTNRFLALSARIRTLSAQYKTNPEDIIVSQIVSLRKRVVLIRNMQGFAAASLFLCVLCMFAIFGGLDLLGKSIFAISLLLMLVSIGISIKEIAVSVEALNMELSGMEQRRKRKNEA
ncbi:MAG: DUF2721 domain-containing protein [Thermodesulfobacteriota bacterium]